MTADDVPAKLSHRVDPCRGSGRSRPDPVTLAILAGGIVAIFALSALALPVVNATTRYDAVGYE